jgi:hypothetical protein
MRSAGIVLNALLGILLLGSTSVSADHHEATEAADPAADREVVVAEQSKFAGTVVGIDRDTRTLTVEGPAGRRVDLVAPKQATNFDAIALGDEVTGILYESVALAIRPKAEARAGASQATTVALAPAGGTPGGVIADTVQLEAVVRAVDLGTRSVTLEGPNGKLIQLKVRPGVKLEDVRVGQQVVATRTQALAIQIDRPGLAPSVASPPPASGSGH